MEATRTITKETPKGKIEIIVNVEKSITERMRNFDGYEMGMETVYTSDTDIIIKHDGKRIASGRSIKIISPEDRKTYLKLTPATAYAYLSNNFFMSESTYNEVKLAIEECNAEVTTPETIEQEKIESDKETAISKKLDEEDKKYKELIASGMCPKCGTWCHGDCEANYKNISNCLF